MNNTIDYDEKIVQVLKKTSQEKKEDIWYFISTYLEEEENS